ncbi:hypothetical protein DFH09DRAFT_1095476 [Mycena vulgaris]|nr:hypothetical protein DFH09DRAFT_1095476 [Mycena vulgaris]
MALSATELPHRNKTARAHIWLGTHHVFGTQPMQGGCEPVVFIWMHLKMKSWRVMYGKAREPGVELFSGDPIGEYTTDHDFADVIRGRNRREGIEYHGPSIGPLYRNAEEHEA